MWLRMSCCLHVVAMVPAVNQSGSSFPTMSAEKVWQCWKSSGKSRPTKKVGRFHVRWQIFVSRYCWQTKLGHRWQSNIFQICKVKFMWKWNWELLTTSTCCFSTVIVKQILVASEISVLKGYRNWQYIWYVLIDSRRVICCTSTLYAKEMQPMNFFAVL